MNKIVKPKNWYAFRWECKFHHFMNSNLHSSEEMHCCLRPFRDGTPRKEYDPASCKVHVCPVLKGKFPMSDKQKELI